MISELSQLIRKSEYTVVFTGAGISTASGIPDYRSKTGLWRSKDPSKLASVAAMQNNRQEFIEFYKERVQLYGNKKPNRGHLLLADWEKEEKLHSVITQNIDGFHRLAGNQNVIELHGTIQTFHCQNCGKKYPNHVYIHEHYECCCGGFIRPSITLFGEMLPEKAFQNAETECEKADLMIVLGSSLTVSPANQIPLYAKQTGAKLVIINKEPTEFDHWADVVYHEDIIHVLEKTNAELNEPLQ